MYNLLIGGAAGQGIETTAAVLEKLLKKSGYHVFTVRDFMSRVRGGHNFTLIRFGSENIQSHSYKLDGVIALNDETVELHKDQIQDNGFILCDSKLSTSDPKAIKIDMEAIAQALGNPRVTGSIATGAVLRLFGESADYFEDVLKTFVKESVLDVNVKAMTKGYNSVRAHFPKMESDAGDTMILSGFKAMSLGAIAAGLKFYSAYPMSPSTSVMEFLAEKSEEAGIVVEQAEDEIAAVNMAIGASFAGARAMTGTSGGGFSLMVEALGLSGMAEIPLVIADVQRPGPVTGLPTRTEQSDLAFVVSASQGEFPRMVIALRHHADAFYQTIRAFDLAEKYQIPVILLSDQYLADASATVVPFDLSRINVARPADAYEGEGEYRRYSYTDDGISPRLIPGKSSNFVSADSDEHDEIGRITEAADVRIRMMDKRMKKLKKLGAEIQEPEFLGPQKYDTLLVGWGSTYGPIAEAVKALNEYTPDKFAALVFGDVFPLPTALLLEKSVSASKIINIEQNATGQLAGLIREYTGIVCTSSILKYDGRQISGEEIADRLVRGV
ncbi:MAG: 2-oxoacid:acceptor oxidoreductase subunit alpha [Eubacteriales bacterium]